MLSRIGNKITVNRKASMTPAADMKPNTRIGSNSEAVSASTPAEVVKVVTSSARPVRPKEREIAR